MKRLHSTIFLALLATVALARPAFAFKEGACKADEEKYCKSKSVTGELKKCMEQHIEQLSPDCKTNILEMAAKAKEKKAKDQ